MLVQNRARPHYQMRQKSLLSRLQTILYLLRPFNRSHMPSWPNISKWSAKEKWAIKLRMKSLNYLLASMTFTQRLAIHSQDHPTTLSWQNTMAHNYPPKHKTRKPIQAGLKIGLHWPIACLIFMTWLRFWRHKVSKIHKPKVSLCSKVWLQYSTTYSRSWIIASWN